MPILDIEVVKPKADPAYDEVTVQSLADAAGVLLDSAPAGTWVKLNYIDSDQYAENQGRPATEAWPVFVEVLQYSLPPEDQLARQSKALALEIGKALGRPTKNIHIYYLPEGKGRIAFGGELASKE